MPRKMDLFGLKFGRLTVLSVKESDGTGITKYVCYCECGNEKVATHGKLRSGHVKSCGCLQKDNYRTMNITHGATANKNVISEYRTYYTMKSRCLNVNNPAYYRYGGRGILICDRWLGADGFKNFLSDRGKGFEYIFNHFEKKNRKSCLPSL